MIKPSHNHELNKGTGGFFSREAVSSVPWTIFGKLVLFFVYIGVSVLTVNGLGKEKFGIFSLLSNIASYLLVLCGLGLGSALMRYVPELASHRNRNGLIHLLRKSAALQLIATCTATVVLFNVSEPLQRLFQADHIEHFRFYLMLACGLVGLLLLKDFVATVYIAIFKTRTVAILSIVQGVVWLIILSAWLLISPEVSTVLWVQIFSLGAVYAVGSVMLIRHVRQLPWRSLSYGIGKRRTLKFSGTAMLSATLRTVMFKYSEIFFLAAVAGTTVAGVYDLGYSLPFTIVTFIPLALLPLFTSAFAEAYVKDRTCLGRLISSYYKLLMMVSLPVAILGSFFSADAYHIIYNGEMDEAGRLASAFCLVLCLSLVSMPLSMALKAKEKAHNMIPMMVLQIIVNLFLDWLLIVHLRWGMWGGIFAVLGTFLITIYPRMLVVRRVLGGIHFPGRFFLRICMVLAMEGGLLRWLVDWAGLFEIYTHNWVNFGMLFAIAGLYLLTFLLLVRGFRLIRPSDVADFRALEIKKLNTVLSFLTG
jgi:O-antigen/teichoic acid export membrane protein